MKSKGLSKDYKRLKELLDNGEQVVVFVQIHPCGYKKTSVIAKTGVDDSRRKFYSIGYGYVFTDNAFFGQCKALELEY